MYPSEFKTYVYTDTIYCLRRSWQQQAERQLFFSIEQGLRTEMDNNAGFKEIFGTYRLDATLQDRIHILVYNHGT